MQFELRHTTASHRNGTVGRRQLVMRWLRQMLRQYAAGVELLARRLRTRLVQVHWWRLHRGARWSAQQLLKHCFGAALTTDDDATTTHNARNCALRTHAQQRLNRANINRLCKLRKSSQFQNMHTIFRELLCIYGISSWFHYNNSTMLKLK